MTKIKLIISDELKEKLADRFILEENVRRVLSKAEETGSKLLNKVTGHWLACNQELNVTFWVEYGLQDEGYVIYNAYSHRMEIGGVSDAQTALSATPEAVWHCVKCDQDLRPEATLVYYLRYDFPVEMLRCPSCGYVLVTEELAVGKMAEVEQLLEDK